MVSFISHHLTEKISPFRKEPPAVLKFLGVSIAYTSQYSQVFSVRVASSRDEWLTKSQVLYFV